jgi:hypothetical protein
MTGVEAETVIVEAELAEGRIEEHPPIGVIGVGELKEVSVIDSKLWSTGPWACDVDVMTASDADRGKWDAAQAQSRLQRYGTHAVKLAA